MHGDRDLRDPPPHLLTTWDLGSEYEFEFLEHGGHAFGLGYPVCIPVVVSVSPRLALSGRCC